MNIDDAIKHAEEVAERLEGKEGYAHTDNTCKECAEDHRQLAEWLKELKAYKAVHEERTWRLIDADALIETLRESKYMIYHANATFQIILNNEIERCISFVETAPTIKTFTLADIEEQYRKGLEKGLEEARPHGEWISLEKTICKGQLLPFWRTHECSVCSNTGQGDFNFCPKCGADMRKEGEAE